MRFTHEQQFFTNPSPGVARRSRQSGGAACRGQPAVAQARQGAVGRGGRTPHFAPKLGRATSARAGPVAGRLGRRRGASDMDVVQASRGRTTRGRGGGWASRVVRRFGMHPIGGSAGGVGTRQRRARTPKGFGQAQQGAHCQPRIQLLLWGRWRGHVQRRQALHAEQEAW